MISLNSWPTLCHWKPSLQARSKLWRQLGSNLHDGVASWGESMMRVGSCVETWCDVMWSWSVESWNVIKSNHLPFFVFHLHHPSPSLKRCGLETLLNTSQTTWMLVPPATALTLCSAMSLDVKHWECFPQSAHTLLCHVTWCWVSRMPSLVCHCPCTLCFATSPDVEHWGRPRSPNAMPLHPPLSHVM